MQKGFDQKPIACFGNICGAGLVLLCRFLEPHGRRFNTLEKYPPQDGQKDSSAEKEELVRHGGPKPEENRRSIYQNVLHKLTLNKLGLNKL